MTAREVIEQNHQLRKRKEALGASQSAARDSAEFFDSIEGLALLSPANAVDGLYVSTTPKLGLARVT